MVNGFEIGVKIGRTIEDGNVYKFGKQFKTAEKARALHLAVDKATKKVICGWFEIQETTRAYFMKLINNDNDDYIPIIKNQLREHFKKEFPTLTKEQLENKVDEITREILLDDMKKA